MKLSQDITMSMVTLLRHVAIIPRTTMEIKVQNVKHRAMVLHVLYQVVQNDDALIVHVVKRTAETTSFPSLSSLLVLQYPHPCCNVSYHITTWSVPSHIPIAALSHLVCVPFAMQPFHDYTTP